MGLHLGTNVACAFAAGLALSTPSPVLGQSLPEWTGMLGGPFAVGVSVVHNRDESRSFSAEGAEETPRPLQTLLWYPARADEAAQFLRYRDYLLLQDTENGPQDREGEASPTLARFQAEALADGRGKERAEAALALEMSAAWDAPPAPGRFPLVVYAPGFDQPAADNALLCEYLASHGFVVTAAPSAGETGPSPLGTVADILAQVRDVEWLIDFAKMQAHADPERVATMGYSVGGVAALIAAQRRDDVGALVTLDGSQSFLHGALAASVPDYAPENLTVPFLYVISWSYINYDFGHFLGAASPAAYLVKMKGMGHRSFGSDGIVQDHFGSEATRRFHEKRDAAPATGYGTMALYVRTFLDAVLNRDEEAQAFLARTPSENGLPAEVVFAARRGGLAERPEPEEFLALLEAEELDAATDLYLRSQIDFPGHHLFGVDDVVRIGERWMERGAMNRARVLFLLLVRDYPASADAQARLGRFYEQWGESGSAETFYRAALELDPGHREAAAALER